MDLLNRVRALAGAQHLFQPHDRVVVGISGGPDSLCLLDVLTLLAAEWRLELHVAHLDHGLRPEAAAEVALVRQAAEARGWPFHTANLDTRAWAAGHKQSLEEAARNVRYEFLARVAGVAEAPVVAVAHTADDQAETILMHFLRGSGLAGLRGMRPKSPLPRSPKPKPQPPGSPTPVWLARPLLTTTRAEVEAYCAGRGLRPVQDASNLDTTFFRNRLRHVLLPELETYNPNIRAVLSRTATVLAGEYEVLDGLFDALWQRTVSGAGPQLAFDRERWAELSMPEQRALLRRAVQHLLPDERDLDFTPLDQGVQFSRRAAPGRSCDLLRGLRLKVTAEAIVIGPWGYRPAPTDLPLLEDGRLPAGWQLQSEMLADEGWSPGQVAANPDPWCAYVDGERLPAEGWRLRARRPGDRFQPLGLGGHSTKLADFLINARIEAALRDRWPLVTAGDAIVWVAGLRLDERFRVTAGTRRVVRLRFLKHADGPTPDDASPR